MCISSVLFFSQIYLKLAEDQDSNQNSSGNNQSSQQMMLLSKSKTALYQALDRLETEQNDVSVLSPYILILCYKNKILYIFIKKK